MTAVAVAAHALIGMPWAAAFALGAIVSPTDPLAAGLIMRGLDVPRRMVSLVEGEGLFNDATALVAYRVAVGAVVAGSFSLGHATVALIVDAAAGIAIGLAVGWIIAEVRRRTPDPQISVTISLVSAYAAFVPANAIGASGVLAAVTTGIYMGIRGPSVIPARVRLQGFFTWDILDFIINSALFVLVGLQLRGIVEDLAGYTTGQLVGWALAICGVTVLVRIVWFFTVPYLVRAIDRRPSQRARRTPARNRLVVGWSGMRGAVSLAAALAQIDALAQEDWTRDDTIERMRAAYTYRKRRLAARAGKIEDDGYEDRSMQYQQAVQLVLAAQRDALVELRRDGTISNETMNRVIQALDLEESRLEI